MKVWHDATVLLVLVTALTSVHPNSAQAQSAAADEMERACEQGRQEVCLELGQRSERLGTREGLSRARWAYFFGCRGDHLRACARLAMMLEEGTAGPRDLTLACQLQRFACGGGDQLACSRLALMLRDGRGVERDPARARELLMDACGRGDEGACEDLDELIMTRADVDHRAVGEGAIEADDPEPASSSGREPEGVVHGERRRAAGPGGEAESAELAQ